VSWAYAGKRLKRREHDGGDTRATPLSQCLVHRPVWKQCQETL
jgi:hypothetical protein